MNGKKERDYKMIMELHSVKFNDWLDEEHEKFQNDWEEAQIKYYKAKELLEE